MNRELRPYQHKGINSIAAKVAAGTRKIIFQLATGGGKTITFAGLVNRFLVKYPTKKVVILVHRAELLKQAHRALFEWYDIAAAPITANSNCIPNVNVYVCMVETANNRLKKNSKCFGDVGLLIVDECHIGNFKKLYEYFSSAIIIGFTATPLASSKTDPLKNHFEDIVCGVDIPDLIASRSLVKNKTYHIKNVDRKNFKIKNGEFDERQMGNVLSSQKHVLNTINAYKKYADGTKAIVFNCNIEHSKKVHEAFLSFGYPSRHLDGETPDNERAQIMHWFKHTPGAILNNVGVATTGFDEPSVITAVVNRLTMSLPLWLQMTGRASRPFPDKDHFIIIDMGGNATTHGDWCVSRDWNELFHNPEKAKEGGEAPSKECWHCSVVIHASCKICPHCGGNVAPKAQYDGGIVKLQLLTSDRPIDINVHESIAEMAGKTNKNGEPYKDLFVVHSIKMKIIAHVKYKWRLKTIDDKTADHIIKTFQDKTMEWCQAKNKMNEWRWLKNSSREWMEEELKRVFQWEPKG